MNGTHILETVQQPDGRVGRPQLTVDPEQLTTGGRLYGLPCPQCGAYYFSDEPDCPICRMRSQKLGALQQPITTRRLYGLPCPKCGAYYFSDESSCPVCRSRRVNGRPNRSM